MSEEQKKPDYKDFGISENMYQKKYINKEEEPIPTFGVHLISLILGSIPLYFFYRYLTQIGHEFWGIRDKWTSETSFYESLELIWESWSPNGIFSDFVGWGIFVNFFLILFI